MRIRHNIESQIVEMIMAMTDRTMTPIESAYCNASPRSREAFERGRTVMSGVAKGAYYYAPYPLTMARGEGCYLHDIDGRKFVDFANHHTAQILGHNHPAVMEAVRAQMEKGIAVGAAMGIEAELAEEMCRRVASVDCIRFCNSGTEATLHAIRLARGFSGRPKIAKFEGGYHGSHDIVEVSVAPALDKAGPESTPHAVPTTGGISSKAPEEVVVLPYNDEDAVERLVTQHRDELACVIFDPKTGILPLRKEFVQAVRKITAQHDVLLIFDEIVGFRTCVGGLQAHYGIAPDLTTFGKIIGGGFPVGAFGGRADIMALFDPTQGPTGFFQSGTFSAHPVVMAAGLAMLRQLTPETYDHLNRLAGRLHDGLSSMFERNMVDAKVVSTGSTFSIYFTGRELKNYRDLTSANGMTARQVFLALVNQGCHLSPSLTMNCLSSPMDESHVDGLIEAMQEAIKMVG